MEEKALEFSHGDMSGLELEMLRSKISGILDLWPKMKPSDTEIIRIETKEMLDMLNSPEFTGYMTNESLAIYEFLRKRIMDGEVHTSDFYHEMHCLSHQFLGIIDSPAIPEY